MPFNFYIPRILVCDLHYQILWFPYSDIIPILHPTSVAFCCAHFWFDKLRWFALFFRQRLRYLHSLFCLLNIFTANFQESLQGHHNGRDNVSNHQPHDCLLNRLFGRRSNKTSKLCVTGLCAGNSSVTGEFPAQMASNAENVSIWWRHHEVTAFSFRNKFVVSGKHYRSSYTPHTCACVSAFSQNYPAITWTKSTSSSGVILGSMHIFWLKLIAK